jgi:phosphatidylserine/phosphatidylglycerophosphate/cardiolipin synthase-like enzyme
MLLRPAGLLSLLFVIGTGWAAAQTAPAPYDLSSGDYVFSSWPEASPAGTYPANMRFHRGPGQDPGLTAEPNADYVDGYALTSGSRINGMGSDGFSFLNTGTNGNLGAAVLALNTTGLANIQVSWVGGTVAANPRHYRIRLQYRVGASGAFTDVAGPVEYVASSTGHSESFTSMLPGAVENQPVVHLRWKYYQAEGGPTGARPRLRIDDITVVTADAPGSGTGTAVLEAGLLRGGQDHDLVFTLTGRSDAADDLLTNVDLTLPDGWGPIGPLDVILSPAGGDVAVAGQTVRISGVSVTQSAPLQVMLENVSIPDESGRFTFGIRTGAGSDQTVAIAAQPALLVWSTPMPIADAGANDPQGVSLLLGEWVTIRGVVTVSDQFRTGGGERGPSYLEDASGGMAVFSPVGVAAEVDIGEEVILLGQVDQFFGLNQLDNSTIVVEALGVGNEVEPAVVTLAQLASDGQGGVEVYEGRLVRVNGVTVNTGFWNVEGSGTNYVLNDGTATLDVRVNPGVDFANTAAPSGEFDIVGVVSQFSFALPHIGGYQLMPRFGDDLIVVGDAPAITGTVPFEKAATPTSVTISWTTDRPAHSEVRYNGAYTSHSGVVVDEEPKTEHTLVLTDLAPASIYDLEIRSAVGTDTTRLANYPVSTTAPAGATHEIQVYFTGTVDHDLALFTPARSGSPVPRLLELIDGASHSLDVALYSLSGTIGASIGDAIIAAHNRGVAVRVTMDNDTGSAVRLQMQSAGVPVIIDSFGPANDGQGLHHNKFVVVDNRGGAPDEIWVMMGSWNPTDPGTTQHNQNILFIQDGSLATGYQREFDQMWGSKSTTANATEARFGPNKELVAPTAYWIGDVYTRLFFSPQGFGFFGTTEQQIIGALGTAQHSIDLGLNLITRMSIVDAMQARFNDGVMVRGAVGEITTTGSVFAELAAWADVHAHPAPQFGLLHHKYALVDAERDDLAPLTITGSHNWSRSANESNDENTLILHSADITNQFLQELAVRYFEAGGEGTFTVSVEEIGDIANTFSVSANYPNPVVTTTTFDYQLAAPGHVTVRVYDLMGREVMRVLDAAQGAGAYRVSFDTTTLSNGVYLYRVDVDTGGSRLSETRRMMVVR